MKQATVLTPSDLRTMRRMHVWLTGFVGDAAPATRRKPRAKAKPAPPAPKPRRRLPADTHEAA